ncbi:30S ribosomal protein S6 [Candidatus Vecturithrix granuli]|uniref:Small ribosomal subunit protein bS6 n=1 Tax=Vecturithrix granuli TaxID=1499967 RepID=A0A081C9D7_VECG1|nr:30S ribosomal protein S6 [Candidatus Vecturithrix granuli]
MKTYETLFIIHPDLEESEVSKTIDTIQDLITTGGGAIVKLEKWGKRQLAYTIQKKREGYYVLIYFEAPPTLLTELHRRYKLTDTILRYLVIQLTKAQIEDMLQRPSVTNITDDVRVSFEDEDDEGDHGDFEPDEELVASTEE